LRGSSVDKPSPFSKAPTASRPASYSSSIRLLKPVWHRQYFAYEAALSDAHMMYC